MALADEVADLVPNITRARAFMNDLPDAERAEWEELLRRGDLYPITAIQRVFAKRGITLTKMACHRLRVTVEGYVPSR